MRKRYWVLLGLMALGGIGNLIGGSDTPVTASVRDSVAPQRLVVTAPARLPAAATPAGGAAPGFEASLFVTANRFNLRESPSTAGRVLGSLSRNSVVRVGARRGGWVNVSVDGQVGGVHPTTRCHPGLEPGPILRSFHSLDSGDVPTTATLRLRRDLEMGPGSRLG